MLLFRFRYGRGAASTFRAGADWSHPVGEGIGGKVGLFLPPAAQSI
jgi:hypothetical protein